jgi:hypothetical protein
LVVGVAHIERVRVSTHSVTVEVAVDNISYIPLKEFGKTLPVDPSGQTSVVSTIKIISRPTQLLHCGPGSGYPAETVLVGHLLHESVLKRTNQIQTR